MAYHLKPEERRKLVNQLIKEGKNIYQISKESGISRPTIYKWIKEYNSTNKEGQEFNFKTQRKQIDFYPKLSNIQRKWYFKADNL